MNDMTEEKKTTSRATKTSIKKKEFNEASYEINLQELNSIVAKLESDDLPLDQLIVEYQNGLKIIQQMQQQLLEAKTIIEESNIQENIRQLEESIQLNNSRLGLESQGSQNSNQNYQNNYGYKTNGYNNSNNNGYNGNGYNNNGFNGGNGGYNY